MINHLLPIQSSYLQSVTKRNNVFLNETQVDKPATNCQRQSMT